MHSVLNVPVLMVTEQPFQVPVKDRAVAAVPVKSKVSAGSQPDCVWIAIVLYSRV